MENENPLDLDVLAGKIQLIVQRIKSDSNPEELDQLKKLYKKNVPFSMRGYFTAYLLREVERNSRRGENKKKNERREEKPFEKKVQQQPKKEEKPQSVKKEKSEKREQPQQNNKNHQEKRPQSQQRVVPQGAKTLYVNLGKIGRVYARDLISLIMDGTDITKDDIYTVRVHDKYSFVTMSEENCNKAIEALQGKDHNGRTIQINISKREAKRNGEKNGKRDEDVKAEEQIEEAEAAPSPAPEAAIEEIVIKEEIISTPLPQGESAE